MVLTVPLLSFYPRRDVHHRRPRRLGLRARERSVLATEHETGERRVSGRVRSGGVVEQDGGRAVCAGRGCESVFVGRCADEFEGLAAGGA